MNRAVCPYCGQVYVLHPEGAREPRGHRCVSWDAREIATQLAELADRLRSGELDREGGLAALNAIREEWS